MTPADDFPGDMEEFPFDDHAADALLGAPPGSPDVPESLRDVADLVCAARQAGSADELTGEGVVVAEIAAAIGESAAPPRRRANERIAVLRKYRTAKVAAATTVALTLGGGVAAAATGSLPTPLGPHHHVELAAQESDAPTVHQGVFGEVASVNGVSDPGTCGTSGAGGSFTITDHDGNPITVDVAPDTKFFGEAQNGTPSFADVCVGQKVGARGDATGSTVTAAMVFATGGHHDADHPEADHHEADDHEVQHHEGDNQKVEQHAAEHDGAEHETDHESDDADAHEADHEVEQPEVEKPEVDQPAVGQPAVGQPDAEHHDAEHHDGEHHDGGSDHSGSEHSGGSD